MAKDDYHVIVYQILAYLYRSLKEGAEIDPKMLEPGSPLLKMDINYKYYCYIIENLLNSGYIVGATITKAWGRETVIENLGDLEITPLGIEYLCENSTIKKAYEFAKDILSIAPIKL